MTVNFMVFMMMVDIWIMERKKVEFPVRTKLLRRHKALSHGRAYINKKPCVTFTLIVSENTEAYINIERTS